VKKFVSFLIAIGSPLSAPRQAQNRAGYRLQKSAGRCEGRQKLMLLEFTGSDWCGWCMKLDKEVFPRRNFKTMQAETLSGK